MTPNVTLNEAFTTPATSVAKTIDYKTISKLLKLRQQKKETNLEQQTMSDNSIQNNCNAFQDSFGDNKNGQPL